MTIYQAINFGKELAATGWTVSEVEELLNKSSYGPQTKSRIKRAYHKQIAKG